MQSAVVNRLLKKRKKREAEANKGDVQCLPISVGKYSSVLSHKLTVTSLNPELYTKAGTWSAPRHSVGLLHHTTVCNSRTTSTSV